MTCFRRWVVALVAVLLVAHTEGCALLIGGAVAGGAAGTAASVQDSRGPEPVGTGDYVGSVLANVVYFPAKVLFAGAGAVTSGLAYVCTLGDRPRAEAIWDASVDGTYVITPRMVAGRAPVHFVGTA